MNFLKKAMFGAAAAMALVGSVHATPINVGGVIFDPDAPLNLSGTTDTITQSINPSTGELSGYGIITKLNTDSTFCPGCELTFKYSGYTPVSSGTVPTPAGTGQTIFYTGGIISIYVDVSKDATAAGALGLNDANTTNGVLWLQLAGHNINGTSLTGINFTSLAGSKLVGGLLGNGQWDVTGGLADSYLNTNTQADGSDFSFTNSFTTFPTNSILFATGSGTFNGSAIPEPGSMALIGLGMLAAGVLRRRNAAK
ncbi:PEP-CTERM sorting domain-containing protein [Undibacterium terreum]|uniref:Ice-binding protein C-terminal domain-containing protein n=1 Tax=Undibacterium terreum TaxID=1224302 RepID=A0A916V0C3_9BURK|nr:PEP-CTERM sorting domain-containing protein [Undibacterium terreum]GGC96953.1 hypothetical protein GCM10011396_50520 [Undibacterium terreum]